MIDHQPDTTPNPSSDRPKVSLPVAWGALEDAFENNAPEVHSYLQLSTGEVIRVVDGVADPVMHARISADSGYLRIDPVSSREQYRWMERFIATVEDGDFRRKLLGSIDGKGAFRRFKDVLMTSAEERERWFEFRSERLKTCMEAWLGAHGLEAVAKPEWHPPEGMEEGDEIESYPSAFQTSNTLSQPPVVMHRHTSSVVASPVATDMARERLKGLIDALPSKDIDMALSFLEFLRDRGSSHSMRPVVSRVAARATKASSGDGAERIGLRDMFEEESSGISSSIG